MTKRKRQWRTRTTGTASQRGQHFVIDDESQQARKARLPAPSIWIRGSRPKTQEIKEREDKKEKPKTRMEKVTDAVKSVKLKPKKPERRLMGQPIEEYEEPTVDDELRDEAGDVKVVLIEANRSVRDILTDFRNYVMRSRVGTRIGHYIERKRQEKESELS